MTATRSVFSNAAWNAFGTLVNIVIAFLLAPLMINRLGIDDWGLLLLVWSVAGVLGLSNFGLGEATLRYVARYYAERDLAGVNRVLGASLTYYVLACAAISIGVWILTPAISGWVKAPDSEPDAVESLLRLTTLLFSAGMLTNAFRAIPMALHRYDISSAIGLVQGIARSVGLVVMVFAGFGVVQLVIWEVVAATAGLVAHLIVARRLLPGLRWLPSMSIADIREIIGYSMFSFITHIFLMVYRESGRLLLGNRLGTASVAYFGTPDSVAYRLHMIVVNGIETLVPRFSASRDEERQRILLFAATWAAFACAVVVYVPLAVLMPDLLRLWINPDFAQQSAEVGRLLTLGLIGSAVFAPIATRYRGQGSPAFVTAVMAAVGLVVLIGTLMLIPNLGVAGVGYAYVLGTVPWLGGLVVGWARLYGAASLLSLVRIAVAPLVLGCILGLVELGIRRWWGEPGWFGLLLLGTSFAGVGALVVFSMDLALGHDSPAGQVLAGLLGQERAAGLRARFSLGRAP